MNRPLVIAVAGPQFSGKSTLCTYMLARFPDAGIVVWSGSAHLQKVVEAFGLPADERSSYATAIEQMRRVSGDHYMTLQMLRSVGEPLPPVIIHDGLRLVGDALYLRSLTNVRSRLLIITAEPELRYYRALGAAKNGRKAIRSFEEFEETENLLTEREFSALMPIADAIIRTDNFCLNTYETFDDIVRHWLAY